MCHKVKQMYVLIFYVQIKTLYKMYKWVYSTIKKCYLIVILLNIEIFLFIPE